VTIRTMQIDDREVHVYHDGIGCRPMSALEVTLWKDRDELAEALRELVRLSEYGRPTRVAIQVGKDILARLDAEKLA